MVGRAWLTTPRPWARSSFKQDIFMLFVSPLWLVARSVARFLGKLGGRRLSSTQPAPLGYEKQVGHDPPAWVADQELESIKRRTRDGLERARQQGKVLGPPRKVGPGQLAAMRRMREGGASLRMIASDFECSPSTVMRALRREGVISDNYFCRLTTTRIAGFA